MKALLALLALALPAHADVIVAARSLPAGAVLAADDLLTVPGNHAGSFADLAGLVGQTLAEPVKGGHPILASQISTPVLIERNARVAIYYYHNGIVLAAEARALDSAGAGEMVRVLNLTSHRVLTGSVLADGRILVTGSLLPNS
jgi:flagellar basal body P-ring formation protein FlgA